MIRTVAATTVATTRSKKSIRPAIMHSPVNKSPRKSGKQIKKYYSVAVGWKLGIFQCWEGKGGGKESTLSFKCNDHKGHPNLKEAVLYLSERGLKVSDIVVYCEDGKELPLTSYDGSYVTDIQDPIKTKGKESAGTQEIQGSTDHMLTQKVNKEDDIIEAVPIYVNKMENTETTGKGEEMLNENCAPESEKNTSDTNIGENDIPGSSTGNQITNTNENQCRSTTPDCVM